MMNRGNLYLVEDDYRNGLGDLGEDALTNTQTNIDYSNIATTTVEGASAGAAAGPYGAIIGGAVGLLAGTGTDLMQLYSAPDNAKKAVSDYMNAHRDNSDPKVLPSAPLYMNKWVWIIGSSVVAVAAGSIAYSMYRKKHKARRAA